MAFPLMNQTNRSSDSLDRRIRRIHVVGGPGSGKTTLARQLAQKLGVPQYELDKIACEGLYFHWRPLETRLADIRQIAAQPTWITEGMWLGWTDELLQAADVILWLDVVSWHSALRRVILRFAQDGWDEAKRQSGVRKVARFRDYWRHLGFFRVTLYVTWKYYTAPANGPLGIDARIATTRAATEAHLAAYADKLVHCSTMSDVEDFFRSVSTTDPTPHVYQYGKV